MSGLFGQARHRALEGVAVQVGHAGNDGSGRALSIAWLCIRRDRGNVAIRRHFDQHVLGPALGQQGTLGKKLFVAHEMSVVAGSSKP